MTLAEETNAQAFALDAHALGLRVDLGTQYPTQSLRFLDDVAKAVSIDQNEDLVPQAHLPLRVVIVGAGLGGLATSIALARRGHSVVVLEQAVQLGEVGAGIQIPSNSAKLLQSWSVLKRLSKNAVQPDSITIRRWANGAAIGYTDLEPFKANFGAPYYVCHRAHFHEALHARALELGVEVRLNTKVVEYDAANAAVTLADGQGVEGDIVVAADGVKSLARATVAQVSEPKTSSNVFAAYRATVDVEKMREHEDLLPFLEKPALNIWIGESRHVMTYTISGGQSFNIILSHLDTSDPATWSHDKALSGMTKEFSGWDPRLTKIISLIDKCVKWPLRAGAKLPAWVSQSSKLVVLGDAAHAMVPYMSQGAAMAVEDGAALAVALNATRNANDFAPALQAFQTERIERSSLMQEASMVNGLIWHFADGPEQIARDAAMRSEVEGKPFAWSPNQWSDPVTQWWAYGYHAEDAMEARLKSLSLV